MSLLNRFCRSFCYSLGMGLLWASPFIVLAIVIFVCGLIAYFFSATSSPEDAPLALYFIGLVLTGYAIAISLSLGAIPGLFAGIFAPLNEPLNPFESAFFRKISGEALFSLLPSAAISWGIPFFFTPLLNQTLNILTSSDTHFPFWTLIFAAAYGYGIYLAVRNASVASPKN